VSTQHRAALRRIFFLISLTALFLTVTWSGSVYVRESKHAGESLPALTLAQLIARSQSAPGYVHLQGATPDFTRMVVEDHCCRSYRCVDHFVPLFDQAHPGTRWVPVLSFVTLLPGTVYEARHPFNLLDPVMEGTVDAHGLTTSQIHDLRASGILVDGQTVVFERKPLQGKVPPADDVDVLVPWFIGLPIALVTALIASATLRLHEKQV